MRPHRLHPRRFLRRLLLAGLAQPALLLLAGPGQAGPAHAVPAERVGPPVLWTAPQFVQADAAGRVYLLRTDTYDIFPLTVSRTLGTPVPLQHAGGDGPEPFIRDAAMSADGGDWLLLDITHGPRLFRGGKEQPLPETGWRPQAVALPAGQPLVAVLPLRESMRLKVRPGGGVTFDDKETPPLTIALSGSEWHGETTEDYDFGSANFGEASAKVRFLRACRLAADGRGNLWMADEFGYRLRSFSPGGRLRLTLTVGPGTVALRQRSQEELGRKLADFKRQAGRPADPDSVRFTADRVVAGLTAGRDGRIYLVVQPPAQTVHAELALDRFDPAARTLERLAVAGLPSGRLSLAAGRDALYLAAFQGKDGLWRLPWDLLETAAWTRVPAARLDGEELLPGGG